MAKDYMKMRGSGAEYKKMYSDKYSMKGQEKKKLADNTQSDYVYPIATATQQEDMGRLRYNSVGDKGYSRQAFDYDY